MSYFYTLEDQTSADHVRDFLHHQFNVDYHADQRAERHTYINRECFLNALQAEEDFLNEQKIELTNIPSGDRTDLQHSAIDRLDKRMKQLTRDVKLLKDARDEHFPYYAFVELCSALIDGLGFEQHPHKPENYLRITELGGDVVQTADILRDLLMADDSVSDKAKALENMLANLRSDKDRANDSFDRLLPVDERARQAQRDNPGALYAVLIQAPPQVGSAAIRGENPPAPDESPDGGSE